MKEKNKYDKFVLKALDLGNPKAHTPVFNNLPKFRTILSAINTSEYNITRTSYSLLIMHLLKDSFNFAQETITYDSSLYMANLDVETLFISISLNATINNRVSDVHNENLYNRK